MTRTSPQGASYLLLKCRAEKVPLRDNSVRLVLATPPYLGALGVSQEECPTKNSRRYDAFLASFLQEAGRILKPGGHILLHTNLPPVKRENGALRILFQILRKSNSGSVRRAARVGTIEFTTSFVWVRGICWAALPVWLYRDLVRRYSEPGEIVAHLFSGSGNGALAALTLSRKPVLVDLHYHRTVRKRLDRALGHINGERVHGKHESHRKSRRAQSRAALLA